MYCRVITRSKVTWPATVALSTQAYSSCAATRPTQASASTTCDTSSDVAMLHSQREAFACVLKAKQSRLRKLQEVKSACDANAAQAGKALVVSIFAFLLLQAVVLFDWTYVHFDWNLTEPITYLLGYSGTWIALAWYGNMQQEFGYDSTRRFVEDSRRKKLYARRGLDIAEYTKLVGEVEVLEQLLRGMEDV